ncbi:MAG: flagellar biosynthesis protein FlhB [Acetivibrionales bacterium]|jgi:flagellar biosynthetic protein FlhB
MITEINLQLFAASTSSEERTEKATPKKRRDAREKGHVFQSREISMAIVLLLAFISIKAHGKNISGIIYEFTVKVLTEYPKMDDLHMPSILASLSADAIIVFFRTAGPILLITAIAGFIVSLSQVGFLFTVELLKPKFDRINPISGLKRIFSMKGAVEFVKAFLKVVLISYVSYTFINGKVHAIMGIMNMEMDQIAAFICQTSIDLAIRVCVVLVILGVFDFAYQWWEYEKSLRMTKQEVKDEFKQTEGNPEIKSRIRQKQRQMSLRRMMQEVPKADVIITNPTHFACALKYDAEVSPAPVLIAKGQDYIAVRIKEIAKENNVEIVENKQLARTIYETVDIGQAIPPELYQAVAEVLAFVYSLKGKASVV